MSHHCHGGSCSQESHSHHHGCCQSKACQGHSCSCSHSECGSQQGQESDGKIHELLAIADEAWMDVLKEKIMDHIRKFDSKIDELAKVVAEANHARWKGKMHEQQTCEDYEKKLLDCLHHASGKHENDKEKAR